MPRCIRMPHKLSLRRPDILVEARSWLGTPWHHQGHTKGRNCDCIGLVVEVLRSCGYIPEFVYPVYDRMPHGDEITPYLKKYLEGPIDLKDALPGDVVQITWGKRIPMHLAFFGNYAHVAISAPLSLIHSMLMPGFVAEHIYIGEWIERTKGIYRIPGVS